MSEMTEKKAAELRKPFPDNVIGKLPKGGVELDFVGHAAVTDRLLQVDPEWSWEPVALNEQGLPAYDNAGNFWIRLTICGVTRLGVGDGKNAKECIGDALRNAAMRFGVALDLWSKNDLEQVTVAAERLRESLSQPPAAPDPMTEAKNAVKSAWEQTHAGTFDRATMLRDFEAQLAIAPADASAADWHAYATYLLSAPVLPEETPDA